MAESTPIHPDFNEQWREYVFRTAAGSVSVTTRNGLAHAREMLPSVDQAAEFIGWREVTL